MNKSVSLKKSTTFCQEGVISSPPPSNFFPIQAIKHFKDSFGKLLKYQQNRGMFCQMLCIGRVAYQIPIIRVKV